MVGRPSTGFLLGFLLIPLWLGFSMLRYRLWDIDNLINRALVYGSPTVILALVYLGSVVLLQSLLRGLLGQTSTLPVVL